MIMRLPAMVVYDRHKTMTGSNPAKQSRLWAAFKSYTFGFVGRNILNLGMGVLAGSAWLATWPVSALYGLASGKKRYYKGFNIKIPRPMSPNGWFNHYLFGQRHVLGATYRAKIEMDDHGCLYLLGYAALKALQYNLWDPFKHVITLNMEKLSGGGYIAPQGKDLKEEGYQRSLKDKEEALSYNENDEDILEGKEREGE